MINTCSRAILLFRNGGSSTVRSSTKCVTAFTKRFMRPLSSGNARAHWCRPLFSTPSTGWNCLLKTHLSLSPFNNDLKRLEITIEMFLLHCHTHKLQFSKRQCIFIGNIQLGKEIYIITTHSFLFCNLDFFFFVHVNSNLYVTVL